VIFEQERLGFSSASKSFFQKRNLKRDLIKVKFTLQQAMKAQRRSRGIAILFINFDTKQGWVVSTTPWPL
jgi:hypothetical protein